MRCRLQYEDQTIGGCHVHAFVAEDRSYPLTHKQREHSLNLSICTSKDLHISGDCHTAIKFITNIVGQEIIARYASRFYHF